MSLQTSNSIQISATPEYQEGQSMPLDKYFVWSYKINIKNNRPETIQLLNRHWIIISEKGHVQEVTGIGVIGLQPVLKPGESFEYSSSVHLNQPSGVMMGKYQFANNDKEIIEAEIPGFSLDCPHVNMAIN